MHRDNGVYSFNLWVQKPVERSGLRNQFAVLEEDSSEDEGFQRLGSCLR